MLVQGTLGMPGCAKGHTLPSLICSFWRRKPGVGSWRKKWPACGVNWRAARDPGYSFSATVLSSTLGPMVFLMGYGFYEGNPDSISGSITLCCKVSRSRRSIPWWILAGAWLQECAQDSTIQSGGPICKQWEPFTGQNAWPIAQHGWQPPLCPLFHLECRLDCSRQLIPEVIGWRGVMIPWPIWIRRIISESRSRTLA